jgi:hypothetical protein
MGSFAGGLARRALHAVPLPSRVRELVGELEPRARAGLEAVGRQLVALGEQIQDLAGPRLLVAAEGGAVARGAAASMRRGEERAPVTFTISHAGTAFGEGLFVAGDHDALGRWDVARALPLTIQDGGADGTWSGQVWLPAAAAFQYKYVRWNPSLPLATARWEADMPTGSRNREARTGGPNVALAQADGRFRFG